MKPARLGTAFKRSLEWWRRPLLSASLALTLSATVSANPTGPTVQSGEVQITPGVYTQIQQLTDKAIVDWNSFSIGAGEAVRILQPGELSVILNRVTGSDPSTILGQLRANGQVFLINPNGILFGPNSQVSVGSLVASTLQLSNEDFLAGRYNFFQESGKDLAAVVNHGRIQVTDAGYAVLTGPTVVNEGTIIAKAGNVQLGAGERATLNLDGRNLVLFALQGPVSDGTVLLAPGMLSDALSQTLGVARNQRADKLVQGEDGRFKLVNSSGTLVQSGAISADGSEGVNAGKVTLQSGDVTIVAAGSQTSASGHGTDSKGGEIRVLSDMSREKLGDSILEKGATLSAHGGEVSGDGGFIEVSGDRVSVQGDLDLSAPQGQAGTFLLDPLTIRIISGTDAPNTNLATNETEIGDEYIENFITTAPLTLSTDMDIIFDVIGTSGGADDGIQANGGFTEALTFDTATLNGGDIEVGDHTIEVGGELNFMAHGSINMGSAFVHSQGDLRLIAEGNQTGVDDNGMAIFDPATGNLNLGDSNIWTESGRMWLRAGNDLKGTGVSLQVDSDESGLSMATFLAEITADTDTEYAGFGGFYDTNLDLIATIKQNIAIDSLYIQTPGDVLLAQNPTQVVSHAGATTIGEFRMLDGFTDGRSASLHLVSGTDLSVVKGDIRATDLKIETDKVAPIMGQTSFPAGDNAFGVDITDPNLLPVIDRLAISTNTYNHSGLNMGFLSGVDVTADTSITVSTYSTFSQLDNTIQAPTIDLNSTFLYISGSITGQNVTLSSGVSTTFNNGLVKADKLTLGMGTQSIPGTPNGLSFSSEPSPFPIVSREANIIRADDLEIVGLDTFSAPDPTVAAGGDFNLNFAPLNGTDVDISVNATGNVVLTDYSGASTTNVVLERLGVEGASGSSTALPSVQSQSGTITIKSDGNILLGKGDGSTLSDQGQALIMADDNNVSLQTPNGSVFDRNAAAGRDPVDVAAGTGEVKFAAQSGIGEFTANREDGRLEIDAGALVATVSGANAPINVASTGNLSYIDLGIAGGEVLVSEGGATSSTILSEIINTQTGTSYRVLEMPQFDTISADTIRITSTADLFLGDVLVANNHPQNVIIGTTNGASIFNGLPPESGKIVVLPDEFSASKLVIKTDNAIGTQADPFRTTGGVVSVTGGAGGTYLNINGDATLNKVDTQYFTNPLSTAGFPGTNPVEDGLSATGDILLLVGGNLTLNATVASQSNTALEVDGDIASAGEGLSASNNLLISAQSLTGTSIDATGVGLKLANGLGSQASPQLLGGTGNLVIDNTPTASYYLQTGGDIPDIHWVSQLAGVGRTISGNTFANLEHTHTDTTVYVDAPLTASGSVAIKAPSTIKPGRIVLNDSVNAGDSVLLQSASNIDHSTNGVIRAPRLA